jgi:hypothetical protein
MVLNSEQQWTYSKGLSLRDYFAAAALRGELAASSNAKVRPDPAKLANYAYAVADAMITARQSEEHTNE